MFKYQENLKPEDIKDNLKYYFEKLREFVNEEDKRQLQKLNAEAGPFFYKLVKENPLDDGLCGAYMTTLMYQKDWVKTEAFLVVLEKENYPRFKYHLMSAGLVLLDFNVIKKGYSYLEKAISLINDDVEFEERILLRLKQKVKYNRKLTSSAPNEKVRTFLKNKCALYLNLILIIEPDNGKVLELVNELAKK